MGVIDANLSLAAVDVQTAEHRAHLILFMGITLAMIWVVSMIFIWGVVYRPVKELIAGTHRVADGDLDYRLPVRSNDELSDLAVSFNKMTAEVSGAHAEIEERVRRKTAELDQAHRSLLSSEKMASIGKLAATVAHEVNNPLFGILTYARLTLKEVQKGPAGSSAEAKPKMDKMQAELDAPPAAAPAGPAGPAQVAARWSALVKEMQAIIAAHPEKKAELVRVSAGLPDLIRAGKLDVATKQLEAVEQALKENPREKEYRARYQALEGRLAAALKDPARDASGLRATNAFVVEKAEAGDFEAALKALLKLEGALAAKPAAAAAKPAAEKEKEKDEEEAAEAEDEEEEKEAAEFQKDLKGKMVTALAQVRARAPREGEELKPQLRFMAYLAGKSSAVIVAKKVGSGSKKLLAEIAGAAGGKVVLGDCIFEKGVHTFVLAKVPGGLAKKLTVALLAETGAKYRVRVRAIDGSVDLDSETDVDPDEAGSLQETQGTEIPSGIVAKRKFLIERWQKIPPQINANLKALKDAIAREMPSEDAEELTKLSEEYLDEFYGEMKEAIDDDINSGDSQYKSAIDTIRAFREEIASEPLIQHLRTNPLGANVDVESILLGALSEVEKTLAS